MNTNTPSPNQTKVFDTYLPSELIDEFNSTLQQRILYLSRSISDNWSFLPVSAIDGVEDIYTTLSEITRIFLHEDNVLYLANSNYLENKLIPIQTNLKLATDKILGRVSRISKDNIKELREIHLLDDLSELNGYFKDLFTFPTHVPHKKIAHLAKQAIGFINLYRRNIMKMETYHPHPEFLNKITNDLDDLYQVHRSEEGSTKNLLDDKDKMTLRLIGIWFLHLAKDIKQEFTTTHPDYVRMSDSWISSFILGWGMLKVLHLVDVMEMF